LRGIATAGGQKRGAFLRSRTVSTQGGADVTGR